MNAPVGGRARSATAITSAIKPRPRARKHKGLPKKAFCINYLRHLLGGSPTWARTRDLRINSDSEEAHVPWSGGRVDT